VGRAWVCSHSSNARMGHREKAGRAFSAAREQQQPGDVYERADKDLNAARIQADLGRLEVAERFAAAAVRTFGSGHRRDRAMANLVLAELHVHAGEPCGVELAHLDGVVQVRPAAEVPGPLPDRLGHIAPHAEVVLLGRHTSATY